LSRDDLAISVTLEMGRTRKPCGVILVEFRYVNDGGVNEGGLLIDARSAGVRDNGAWR